MLFPTGGRPDRVAGLQRGSDRGSKDRADVRDDDADDGEYPRCDLRVPGDTGDVERSRRGRGLVRQGAVGTDIFMVVRRVAPVSQEKLPAGFRGVF